jgi:hypothetical protein
MKTEARNTANRRNAARSTGPRTADGKVKASGNSRRHGLTANIFKDPNWTVEVDRLARAFTPAGADPVLREEIRTMAGTMMDVMRVEAVRTNLWNARLHRSAQLGPPSNDPAAEARVRKREAAACLAILPHLLSLVRYERRGLSRWKRVAAALTRAG